MNNNLFVTDARDQVIQYKDWMDVEQIKQPSGGHRKFHPAVSEGREYYKIKNWQLSWCERIYLLAILIFKTLSTFTKYVIWGRGLSLWREVYHGKKELIIVKRLAIWDGCPSFYNLDRPYLKNSVSALTFFDREITEFPSNMIKFSNLKILRAFSSKKIFHLPESIGQLSELEELELDCSLKSLPDSIGNLKKIKDVDLSRNQLSSVPKCVGNWEQLKKINLWSNKLSSLPEEIENWCELTEINLQENLFTTVPECLYRLPSKCKIDLEGNPLTETAIAELQSKTSTPGYQGPQFFYDHPS